MNGATSRGEIRIAYLSTMYHSSILIKGLNALEAEGLRPHWSLFGTGPAIVDALTKAKVDLGYIGLSPTAIGVGKGAPIKCIAGGHVEGTVVIAKKGYQSIDSFSGDMGKTLEQFKGKKLGAPRRGSLHDVFLRFYISQHGLEDKVDVLNYDWADFIPDAIMNGEIEGAAGTPPLAVLSSRLFGGNIVIPASRVWPNNPSYGIVTRKELLLDKPNLLELFLKVHKKGCALIREDPLKAAEVIAKTVQLVDDSFVRETLEVSPKYCASLSKEYVDSTLALLPVLMNLNYLSKNLEKEDIFDFSLIEKVHPEPPHY